MCLRFKFCTHQRVYILYFLKKSQIRCSLLCIAQRKTFKTFVSITSKNAASVALLPLYIQHTYSCIQCWFLSYSCNISYQRSSHFASRDFTFTLHTLCIIQFHTSKGQTCDFKLHVYLIQSFSFKRNMDRNYT
jgi:hypothetical protein